MVIDARGPSIGPSAAEILASHAGGTGSPTKTAVRLADAIAARGDDGTWLSTVPRDQLLAAAEEIEKRPGARTLPLYGVPFGINDSIDVEGCRPHSPAPTTPTLRRRRPRWCGACSTRARCTSARRIWTSSPPDSTAPARPTPSRAVCAATRCVRITVPARGLHRSARMEGRGRPRQLLADQRRDDRNPLFPWAFGVLDARSGPAGSSTTP